ncbi:MAG: DNRLRE domain-containing protein, partial [Verrucomicrobiales bacterium]|nr:DNRLRE domain-containing protein [Verrucomicrobiales bacterium]
MKFAAHRVPGLVVVAAAILLGVTLGSPAATLTLLPDADTMLSEYFPENNFGAMPFANSGSTRMLTRNRALFRFDVAGHLPAGARIRSASLILEVVGQPAEPFASGRFNLHRLLKPWGEGTKTNAPGGGAGQGSPATAGEATWTHRFAV